MKPVAERAVKAFPLRMKVAPGKEKRMEGRSPIAHLGNAEPAGKEEVDR